MHPGDRFSREKLSSTSACPQEQALSTTEPTCDNVFEPMSRDDSIQRRSPVTNRVPHGVRPRSNKLHLATRPQKGWSRLVEAPHLARPSAPESLEDCREKEGKIAAAVRA